MFKEILNEEEMQVTGSAEEIASFIDSFNQSSRQGRKLHGPFELLSGTDLAVHVIYQPLKPSNEIDSRIVYEDIFG